MRKWFILCLLLFAIPCFAAGPEIFMGGGAAADTTTWVYPNGNTTFTDTETTNTAYSIGPEMALGAHTYTKLSVNINDPQTATQCWIAVYNGSQNLISGVWGDFVPAAGWNDVTINYATGGWTVYPQVLCNQAVKLTNNTSGCASEYAYVGAYNATPPSSIGLSGAGNCQAIRMGY